MAAHWIVEFEVDVIVNEDPSQLLLGANDGTDVAEVVRSEMMAALLKVNHVTAATVLLGPISEPFEPGSEPF